MISALFIMRIICLLIWGGVMFVFWPAAARSLWGKPRHMDPVRLCFFFTGVVITGFIGRWLIWNGAQVHMGMDEMVAWGGLYGLTAMNGISILTIMRRY